MTAEARGPPSDIGGRSRWSPGLLSPGSGSSSAPAWGERRGSAPAPAPGLQVLQGHTVGPAHRSSGEPVGRLSSHPWGQPPASPRPGRPSASSLRPLLFQPLLTRCLLGPLGWRRQGTGSAPPRGDREAPGGRHGRCLRPVCISASRVQRQVKQVRTATGGRGRRARPGLPGHAPARRERGCQGAGRAPVPPYLPFTRAAPLFSVWAAFLWRVQGGHATGLLIFKLTRTLRGP